MMWKPENWEWNTERYRELNDYFRVRIRVMLESDPYIKELVSTQKSLELEQITDRMSDRDQELWQEFMDLDQLKFYQDMQNHLEGKGKPYDSRTGFGNFSQADNEENPTW